MKETTLKTSLTTDIVSAFERLMEYLRSVRISDALVHLDDSSAVIKFNPGESFPTNEQTRKILEIFFWDGSLEIENIEAFAIFDPSKNTMVINLKSQVHIANVVNKLRSWHLEVKKVCVNNAGEFSVNYIVTGRGPIDYTGLEEIRDLVDPGRVNKRSVIVFGDGNLYDMKVRPVL